MLNLKVITSLLFSNDRAEVERSNSVTAGGKVLRIKVKNLKRLFGFGCAQRVWATCKLLVGQPLSPTEVTF